MNRARLLASALLLGDDQVRLRAVKFSLMHFGNKEEFVVKEKFGKTR